MLDANGAATGGLFTPDSDDFLTVMSDITQLMIRGDWVNGDELTRLDNFSMTVVPVPSALLLFGTGLLGLIGTAIRKKTA